MFADISAKLNLIPLNCSGAETCPGGLRRPLPGLPEALQETEVGPDAETGPGPGQGSRAEQGPGHRRQGGKETGP